MPVFRKLEKWLKRLRRRPTLTDKRLAVDWLMAHLDAQPVMPDHIYQSASPLRADGEYGERLLQDLNAGLRHPERSLSHETQWGADELGPVPVGEYAQLYILQAAGAPDRCIMSYYGNGKKTRIVLNQPVSIKQEVLDKFFVLIYPY